MLADWLPEYCTRLTIFLSYSSEHRPLAETIAQALKNDGHSVFFDKESLPPAGDYNEQIRKAIRSSDRFIFLASNSAFDRGRYTLTELDFARERWPSPVGRVFPVIVDPEFRPEDLPTYLSSVHAMSIAGNVPAEIAAAVEKTGRLNATCWGCLAVSTLALAGVAGLATGLIPVGARFQPADLALVPSEFVHFRPRAQPPVNPSTPGADTAWIDSPVTVMLPVAYSHRNAGSAPAQVLGEEVELEIGGRKERYAWAYVVEIMGSSIADSRCADWLCQKGNVKAENVQPGSTTATRETMYLPVSGTALTWKDFVDPVIAGTTPAIAQVTITSKVVVADGAQRSDLVRSFQCRFDVAAARQQMLSAGYKPGQNPRPPIWQPRCLAESKQ